MRGEEGPLSSQERGEPAKQARGEDRTILLSPPVLTLPPSPRVGGDGQPPPINTPAATTSAPPSITLAAADTGGVSM